MFVHEWVRLLEGCASSRPAAPGVTHPTPDGDSLYVYLVAPRARIIINAKEKLVLDRGDDGGTLENFLQPNHRRL